MKICPICKKQYEKTLSICPDDSEILEEDLTALVNTTLDGQYFIEKLLGQGGMGAVFLARHTLLGDQVAIKIMPSSISKTADYQRRFLREGKTARQFSHPNVVAVHDLRTTADGMFYMVLEYIDGKTLSDELKKRRRFSPKEAVEILTPIGEALSVAHSMGIIHRDLKPDNIMIGKAKDGSSTIKLLDLGIAKVISADATALTATGQILGTPHYMSPEQWNGDDIDGRADIYSLGIILYELVAGAKPFSGKTIQNLVYHHSVTMPPLLCNVVSNVSKEFSLTVERAILKESAKRPANCQELFNELREALKAEVYFEEDISQAQTLVGEKIDTKINSDDGKTKENPEVAQTKIVEATLVSQEAKENLGTLLEIAEVTNAENSKVITNSNTIKEIQNTQQIKNTQQNIKNSLDKNKSSAVNNSNNLQQNTPESISKENTNNKKTIFAIVSVLAITLLSTTIWYFLKDSSINFSVSYPTPTPKLNSNTSSVKQEKVEVLEYWLEVLPKDKANNSIKKADIKTISSQDYVKFHFLAKQSGYLYILGLGEGNNLTTFLTNNPSPATGLNSNKIEQGEKIVFPNGTSDNGDERVISFNNQPGQENYTIIFSAQPLAAPSFLNSKPGYLLVAGKIDEWEQFQQMAEKVTINISHGNEKIESIAKALSSSKSLDKPIIFNITFEHN